MEIDFKMLVIFKERGKMREFHWLHVVSLFLLIMVAGFLSQGNLTGGAFYRDYGDGYGAGGFNFFGYGGYGGFGYFNFSEMYYQYASLIDAVIFLVIFLSLGKSIFGEHFKESKGVYIGIGLFLTMSLLLWEERTGFSLVERFGPFVFFIFLIVLIFYVFKWIKEAGAGALFAAAVAYLIFFFFVSSWIQDYDLMGWLPDVTQGMMWWLLTVSWILAWFVAIGSLIYWVWSKLSG